MLSIESLKISTKWQVLTSVMALIIVTCCCFTLLIFHINRENLDAHIDHVISNTSLIIQTIEDESSYPLKTRLESIAKHRTNIITPFALRDRQALQKKSKNLFTILRREYPSISTLGWITPDNKAFLRTHAPDLFGDDITQMRPDIVTVNKTHKPISGYNSGYIGLQFRIVQPVFFKEQYIGALQIGLSETHILDTIKTKLNIPAAIVVTNEGFATVTKPQHSWTQFSNINLFSYQADIFTSSQQEIDWFSPTTQIKYHGKKYIFRKVLDLNNFNNTAIGSIVVALDVTEQINEAQYHLYITILVSILLIGSSFLILNKSYTKLIQTIVDLNQDLKKSNDQLEGKIKEHSAKLHLIVQAIEQTSETIVITDEKGIIQYSNNAFEKLTGYTCAESIGKSTSLFKSGIQDESFYKHLWKTILSGKIWTGPIVNKRKDGSHYDELLTISPIFDAKGSIFNFVAIKRDISEEINLERKLNQMIKMESIGRLAGGIAHDFNNILSVINGYSDLCLMKMETDNPYKEYIKTIHQSGLRAAQLTQQLLAFSRKQIIQKKIIYINEAMADINNLLTRLLGEDIDIKINIPDTIWAIKIDHSQLEQIIINLAVNSRDAMPLGGSLLISAKNITKDETSQIKGYPITTGDYIQLEFSDTGQGMSKEVAEQIFEPFFTTKEQGKGTGLGLATVYGIVKQNHGLINVYSELGIGTTFTLYLPAERDPSGQEEVEQTTTAKLQGGTETILLVEDEKSVRGLCEEILSNLGYTVIGAQDGHQAIEVEEQYKGPIHMLLTDVVMPKMNGSELAPIIKKKRPDVKILFMSGYTEDSIAQHGILEEGINFINKPVSPAKLADQVRLILDDHFTKKCKP